MSSEIQKIIKPLGKIAKKLKDYKESLSKESAGNTATITNLTTRNADIEAEKAEVEAVLSTDVFQVIKAK